MNDLVKHSTGWWEPMIALVLVAAVMSLGLLPNESLAEIYKCKEAKGKITYSNSPCQSQDVKLSVDKGIQYWDSAEGKRNAAINKPKAEAQKIRQEEAVEFFRKLRNMEHSSIQVEHIRVSPPSVSPPSASPPGRDIGLCMGDCASEQGICIAQCESNGNCIANCASAWGRCASRCN